jgi:hypothetical protein
MDERSFYSIDRLVEFGMGMAMAQQMIQMMNQTMKGMYVPGSIQSMPAPQSSTMYVAINGRSVGPLSESDFVNLVNSKQVTKDSLVWIPGMQSWAPVSQVPAALRVIAMTPPPIH